MKIAAAAANLPTPAAALSLWGLSEPVAAPAEHVVAAVLQFGDVREERDDGTTLIRFTRSRLEREDMQLLLGDDLYRALDVSLIWDEAEDQLVRVLDLAPLRHSDGQRRARATRPNRYADAHMRSFPRERFWFEPQAA
jgi:hypothetical protein